MRLEATGRISDAGLGQFARAVESVGLAQQLTENSAGHLSLQMDAYTVHPYALVRGLAQQAAHAGVRIREQARVRSIESDRIRLDEGGTLTARRIVICTNAYNGTLDVGERIRALVIHAFLMVSTPTARPDDGAFTIVLDRDQAFVRMHERRILYGGGDKLIAPRGDDYAVPDDMRARLAEQMHRRFPGTEVAEAWAGKFHATANGLPIIRPSKTNRAVILNVGYGGTGVALTLVCARLAAAVASDAMFITADDARLLSIMQRTQISVRDLARSAAGIVRGLFR
jgi:glycine/D-amino acid oxidase-like deaminating enzyme